MRSSSRRAAGRVARSRGLASGRVGCAAAIALLAAFGAGGLARAEGAQESLAAARALSDSGDYETALVFYEKAAQQDPTSAVAHAGVGKMRFQLGDAQGAVVAYQNAVRFAPNVPALQQALRQAQAVAARNAAPPPTTGWGAPAQAPSWGAPAVAAPRPPPAPPPAPVAPPPSPAEQQRQQGVKHYDGGRYLFAIKAFEKAIALGGGDPETHARLGDSHLALRRTRDAVSAYRKAAQGAPYNVEINLAFAHALAADGDVDGAKKAYQAVLEIQPGERRAREALAELKKHAARSPAPPVAAAVKPAAPAPVAKGPVKGASAPPVAAAAKPAAPASPTPEAKGSAKGAPAQAVKPEVAAKSPAKGASAPTAKAEVTAKGPAAKAEPTKPEPPPPPAAKGKKKGGAADDLIGDLMADPLGKGD